MGTYRRFIYREAIYRGPETPVIIPKAPVAPLDEFVIRIYDRAGVLIQQITNRVGRGIVNNLNFELLESGPGMFKLITATKLANVSYNYRIEVKLWGTDRIWYCGYVDGLPEANQQLGPYEYSGQGYFSMMKNLIIQLKEYTWRNIKYIIHDLMEDATGRPGFEVNYNPLKVSPNLYSVPAIRFKSVTLQRCMTQLGEIAKNHRVGVDVYRDFFFLPRCFQVRPDFIFFEGVDYTSSELKEDVSKIINRIYPKTGKTDDGTNVMAPISDTASINTYGLREGIAEIPSVYCVGGEATDLAARWASGYLRENAYLRISGKINYARQRWDWPLSPDGMARLIQRDGSVVEGQVKAVTYDIGQELQITVDLGWAEDTFSREFVALARATEFNAAIGEMTSDQSAL